MDETPKTPAKRSFIPAVVLTLIFFGTGTTSLFLGYTELSWVIFALLPVLLGISIGILPDQKWALIGVVLTTISFLAGLYIAGASGFICVIMALPIIILFIFIGAIIAHYIKEHRKIKNGKIQVLVLPLLLFVFIAPVEHYLNAGRQAVVTVTTTRIFAYTPDEVFDAIKSVDTLYAEKPWMMNFDLPVPTKCILEKEEPGGIRTCYFSAGNLSHGDFGSGTITEKITSIKRGKELKMDVIGCTIIGRNWLGFREAIYYFEKVKGNRCKLTRITTYTSKLGPRFYWEPIERLGIEQEHDYVFNNLQRDLDEPHKR